jgi:hypothetical protein
MDLNKLSTQFKLDKLWGQSKDEACRHLSTREGVLLVAWQGQQERV